MAVNRMNAVFMEVIEWFDESGETLVQRIPPEGSAEIKYGAQLVVRESQRAAFFSDGRIADLFGPGRHTLDSNNLPILTKLLSLPWGFTSPFRCEVCFVNMKTFTSMRWGTKEPVAFRDSEFGMVRLRAFGSYTMRVTDPVLLINNLAGTEGTYTTTQVEELLRDITVARLNDLLGETLDTLLHLPARYDEISAALKTRLTHDFGKFGLSLSDFYINSITPPAEVQKTIDERSSMNALGNDMERYMKYKAAVSMEKAAGAQGGSGGGEAASGMGIGVGAGLGMMMAGMIRDGSPGDAMQPSAQASGGPACKACRAPLPTGARFCPACGIQAAGGFCSSCGKGLPQDARFCPNCGKQVAG